MSRKNIFITGIQGFVGSNLAINELSKGNHVVGVVRDRNHKTRQDVLDRCSILSGDITDPALIDRAVGYYEIDTVFHLAANAIVKVGMADPVSNYKTNIMGTVNVLDSVRRIAPKAKVVVASCYDTSTRAWTTEGLKSYDEIKVGDTVLSLNPETLEVEEAEVEEVVVQQYDGPMVKYKGRSINCLVTPNHRMVLDDKKGGLVFIPAEEKVHSHGWRIPTGRVNSCCDSPLPELGESHWNAKKINDNYRIEDLLYILGIYIGDGCIQQQVSEQESKTGMAAEEYVSTCRDSSGRFTAKEHNGSSKVLNKKTTNVFHIYIPDKDPCRERVEKTLTRLGVEFGTWKHGGEGALYFSSAQLVPLFKETGTYAKNKRIPRWAFNYGYDQLYNLFEGIMDSDGNKESRTLTTVSEKLVEDMMELTSKLGLHCSFKYYLPQKKKPVIEGREINSTGAYYVYVNRSVKNILPYMRSEEEYSGNVWCLRLNRNKNFLVEREGKTLFCGNSDKAYGDHKEMPYREEMKLNPGCPYSTSKSCTDMISQSYANSYNMDVNTVRCSNIYGPGDMNTSRLIPNSILRCLRGLTPVIYSGVASYRREFIYVEDVAKAYSLVADKGAAGEIYNIGINSFHTIKETVTKISELVGVSGVEIVDKDFPEIPFQWMDGTKLKALGWEPEVSFDGGLSNCVEWYTNRHQKDVEAATWASKEK